MFIDDKTGCAFAAHYRGLPSMILPQVACHGRLCMIHRKLERRDVKSYVTVGKQIATISKGRFLFCNTPLN